MSNTNDHARSGETSNDDKRPEDITPSKDDMRDDDEMGSGDEGNDAMTKTMTDQAKKAGDGSDDEEEGLNQDG